MLEVLSLLLLSMQFDDFLEFQFHAAGMNFHSESYQWLVVNQGGTNAQFKGTGTLAVKGGRPLYGAHTA